MTYTICYSLIFLAEIFTSLFYFENKFERKTGRGGLIIFSIVAYVILYAARLTNLTWVNIMVFAAGNLLLLYCCYQADRKAAIFQCSLLLIVNVLTEAVVMFFSSALLGTDLLACLDNSINLIFQSTVSKLLYFLVIYFLAKIAAREYGSENNTVSLALFVLPVSSVLMIYSVLYALAEYDLKQTYLSILTVAIVFLLLSNLIVFWIYEITLQTNRRNMELKMEQQKEKSTAKYYELLNKQNEDAKIVMHDIKRHLNVLKGIAQNGGCVPDYIDKILEDFDINKTIEYCRHPVVNVIVNRYKTLCEQSGIKMNIDIRNAQFEFISEPDITALLDNILENAVEAAGGAEHKFIDLSIFMRKNRYLSIVVTNSVKDRAAIVNHNMASLKKSDGIHGTGLKSIKRVVKKNEGEFYMNFNEDDMTVTSNIVFQRN